MSEKRAKVAKVSFEEELRKLEEIVRTLESGDVPLAELVARYEDGMKHLRACREFLSDAELRLTRLKSGSDGDTVEPFTLPASGE